jgi:hypothetical protein
MTLIMKTQLARDINTALAKVSHGTITITNIHVHGRGYVVMYTHSYKDDYREREIVEPRCAFYTRHDAGSVVSRWDIIC